jgi:hypothetical protein
MTELEMASVVAHILSDKDFIFVDRESYLEAVKTALYEYSSYYPKRVFSVISVDTINGALEYDLSDLPGWNNYFSIVIGIELHRVENLADKIVSGTYVRPNYYDIAYNDLTGTYKLRILFRFKGDLKVYYTAPYSSLSEVPDADIAGIKYLAAYYACLSASSKASQLVENYIGAEKMMFDRRAKNFMELADKYRSQAYTLLNIPDGGIYPFSATISIPYIERRRAIRRTI